MLKSANPITAVLELEKRELDRNVAKEETANLRGALLCQYNWSDVFQSAPTAINSMGTCFIAASSEKAVVTLKVPEKGFQHLKYSSLQANLIETANLGRFAFNKAETGMGQISLASDIIYAKLRDVLNVLADPESAKVLLKPQINAVSKAAVTCATSAKDFNGCRRSETQLDEGEYHDAVSARDLLAKQVEAASDAFKKASDEFPAGFRMIGQQVVGDLANCATTSLRAAIPMVVFAYNPLVGAAQQSGTIFQGLKDFTIASGMEDAAKKLKDDAKQPRSDPDPAAAELLKSMTYLDMAKTMVYGHEGDGIDWERSRGTDSSEGSALGIAYIAKVLEDASITFTKLKIKSPESANVSTILTRTSQIANEISNEVQRNKSMSATWLAADAPQVRTWISDFRGRYEDAVRIQAGACAQSGGTTTGNIIFDVSQVAAEGLKAEHEQAQMILESATNRLNMTQQALVATQENFAKSSEMLLMQQNKVAEVQSYLSRLESNKATLTEVKSILFESIKLIMELKTQINNLVRFFNAITMVVDTVIDLHVDPFLHTIKQITAGQGDPGSQWIVGDYSFTDFVRSNVYSSVLTLRTYFNVFGDIAKMWTQLSITNIEPGLRLCDELSVLAPGHEQIGPKLKKLKDWSAMANDNVGRIAGEKQREIMEYMQERVQTVSAELELLPTSSVKAAIEEGTREYTEVVEQSLNVKYTKSPLSRFVAE